MTSFKLGSLILFSSCCSCLQFLPVVKEAEKEEEGKEEEKEEKKEEGE